MLALAALFALAATSPLDPVRDAVRARWEEVDPGPGRLPPDLRALRGALDRLEADRNGLLDDLGAAGPAARRLDGRWPEFDAPLATAFDGLRALLSAERDALAAWEGKVDPLRREVLLERGMLRADRLISRAEDASTRAVRARRWRRACAVLERTRRSLYLAAPGMGPAPFGGTAPAFALTDANPNSPGKGLPVSTADFAGRLTGWYFTRLG